MKRLCTFLPAEVGALCHLFQLSLGCSWAPLCIIAIIFLPHFLTCITVALPLTILHLRAIVVLGAGYLFFCQWGKGAYLAESPSIPFHHPGLKWNPHIPFWQGGVVVVVAAEMSIQSINKPGSHLMSSTHMLHHNLGASTDAMLMFIMWCVEGGLKWLMSKQLQHKDNGMKFPSYLRLKNTPCYPHLWGRKYYPINCWKTWWKFIG